MSELKLPFHLNDLIDDDYHPMSIELYRYYREFAISKNINVKESSLVTKISKNVNSIIEIDVYNNKNKTVIKSEYVIISTGIYENKNKLNIKDNYNYIFYGMDITLKNKNLALIGGGNSAIDMIINLLPYNKIEWIIRDEKWGNIFYNLELLFADVMDKFSDNLNINFNTTVEKFYPNNEIKLSNNKVLKNIDMCSVLIGFNSLNKMLINSDFEFEKTCLKLNESYETSKNNVYAFGSIMSKWNFQTNSPNPTFIHNGNDSKLRNIINDLKNKELNKIMSPLNFPKKKYGSKSFKSRIFNFFKK
jgi:thioredoxin reductase